MGGIFPVDVGQCMLGQAVAGSNGVKGLAEKRTRIYTNSGTIDNLLDKQCNGHHNHSVLLNGIVAQASAQQWLCVMHSWMVLLWKASR